MLARWNGLTLTGRSPVLPFACRVRTCRNDDYVWERTEEKRGKPRSSAGPVPLPQQPRPEPGRCSSSTQNAAQSPEHSALPTVSPCARPGGYTIATARRASGCYAAKPKSIASPSWQNILPPVADATLLSPSHALSFGKMPDSAPSAWRIPAQRPFQPRHHHLQRRIKPLRPVRHAHQQVEVVVHEAAERWLPARQTAIGCPQGGMAGRRLFHHCVSTSTPHTSS